MTMKKIHIEVEANS